MKKASQIMNTIGRIFNIVEMIGFAIMAIVGIFVMAFSGAGEDPQAALASGISLLTTGLILFVLSLVAFIIATRSFKALNNNVKELRPHILLIVAGVISESVFYLLGGIFGLIAENR